MSRKLEYLASDGDHELTCAVCLDPWTDPVELRPCTHIFCKKCLWRQKKCPVCRSAITSQQKPHRIMLNMVEGLRVRCTECKWEGLRGSAPAHPCTSPWPATPCSAEDCATALRGVNTQMDRIRLGRAKELFEVESKWNALLVQGMTRQHELISGAGAPTDEELALGGVIPPSNSRGDVKQCAAGVELPLVGYWYSILKHFMDVYYAGYDCDIKSHDQAALWCLTGIVYQHLPGPSPAVRFDFHFRKNDEPLPFTNDVLTAALHFDGIMSYDEWIALDEDMDEAQCRLECSDVVWRDPGNNPTRAQRRGHVRPRTSFFNIWCGGPDMHTDRVRALLAIREAVLRNSVRLYEGAGKAQFSDESFEGGDDEVTSTSSSDPSGEDSEEWEDASTSSEEVPEERASHHRHRHHRSGRGHRANGSAPNGAYMNERVQGCQHQ
jgi:hypothetical protein